MIYSIMGLILIVLSAVSATYLFISNEKYRKKIRELKIENEELVDKCSDFRHLAYYDQLTGCLNRNALERDRERLNKERNAVVIVDINDLKAINDKEEHEADDSAIMSAVQVFRIYGTVYRLRGDGFLIVFSDNECLQDFKGYAKQQDWFAYGIVEQGKFQTLSESMRLADKNMYKCKKRQKRTK